MDREAIRGRLRQAIEESDLTQVRVAKEMGVEEKTLYRVLSGSTRNIPAEWVPEIARLTGVGVAWILTDEGSRVPDRKRVADLLFELQGRVMDLARSPKVSSQDVEEYLEQLLRILRMPKG